MKIRVLIAINNARASEIKTIEINEISGLNFGIELVKFLSTWDLNTEAAPQKTSVEIPE